GSEAILAVHAGVDIVEDDRRRAERFLQNRLYVHVFPTQVGGVEDDSAVEVHRSRATNSDAGDVIVVQLRFLESVADGLDNPLHPGFGTFHTLRLAPLAAQGAELVI